jgi:hypothetical protein
MTKADKPALAKILAVLGETFNEPVSKLRAEGYYEGLKEIAIDDVRTAAQVALRTCKFFPRPAELRELVTGRTEDRAALAWSEMLTEVKRVGYIGAPHLPDDTMNAILSLWGGWTRLCQTLPGDGPELIGWMKQFQQVYGAGARQDAAQLVGRSEAKQILDTVTKAALNR